MDSFARVLAEDLSSRYCPHDERVFLVRLIVFVAVVCVAGIVTLLVARKSATWRLWPYAAGWILIAFALGAGALDLFGLSGCSGHFAEGLVWDWPW